MSRRSLPPLNALRVFEAAARHLNLGDAAEELGVTPSAISHQIRNLETQLGVSLFRRANRRLDLSEDGRTLLPGLSEGLDRIEAAVARISARRQQGVITVSMVSTLALRWFLPRLPRFQALYPDVEVRLSTTTRLVRFAEDGIDAAIRHGDGDWPGLCVDKLFDVETLPVCHPDLADGQKPLLRPQDLASHVLLHADARGDDWRRWLAFAGVADLRPSRDLTFETTNFALAAAIRGLGVAIADRHIVAEDVEAGRLVHPFKIAQPRGTAYYFVCPEENAKGGKVADFRRWLLSEAQGDASAAA